MSFSNGPASVTNGLILALDAGDRNSYVSGSSTWFDLVGSNNGTLTNGPTFNTGSGGNIVFDGVNDCVSIPYNTSMDPTVGITIEAWINPVTVTSSRYMEIFRKENPSARQLFSFQEFGTILSFGTSTLVTGYNELDVSISSSNYDNQWTHVVCTYSSASGAKTLYRNSTQIGGTTVAGTLNTGTATYYVASNQGTGEFFNGKIAVVKMYSRALSAQEVLQNYNAQKSKFGL